MARKGSEECVEDRDLIDRSPDWLKMESFWEEEYDVDAYLSDLRTIVPLETLRSELQKQSKNVEENLAKVINEEYNEFVGLSAEVMDVQEAVSKMEQPLEELELKMQSVRSDIVSVIDHLDSCLARREENFRARALLELMQDTSHAVSKVEKLIEEMEQGDPLNYETTFPRLLERIASELSRIQFYIAKGEDLALLKSLAPRINRARDVFLGELGNCLEVALKMQSSSNLQQCLRSYVSVNAVAQAEHVIRERFVKPLLAECIDSQDALLKARVHEPERLEPFYKDVLHGVSSRLGILLRLVNAPLSGLYSFDFLANSVLPEVDNTLGSKKAASFSPGIPSMFHTNYMATIYFLEEIEEYCISKKKLDHLRESEAYKSLIKRWNISVYFTLRFQEIASELDRQLSDKMPVAFSEPNEVFVLNSTNAIWKSLCKCFSEDFYLRELADKFLKLALQILVRYRNWVQQCLDSPSSSQEGGEASLLGENPERSLKAIISDLRALNSKLLDSYMITVSTRLGSLPETVKSAALGLLKESANKLLNLASSMQEKLTDMVADKCVVILRQLRGVTATYRMTSKPPPTKASPYAVNALAPLITFSSSVGGKSDLVEGVAASVCDQYRVLIAELVETVKKTESSLKRLKKQSLKDTEAKVTDTEKICLQLFLDVKEVGHQLVKAGVDPESFEPYKHLWDSAAPEDNKGKVQLFVQETPHSQVEETEPVGQ